MASLFSALGLSRVFAFDWEADPIPSVQIETVRFRGWVPEAPKLRGTLILIPGRHGDGRDMAGNARWQKLAGDLNFALLACEFSKGDPGLYQFDEKGDVAASLVSAVKKLAEESSHPELAQAPVALWGTSAGSNVASRFCARLPKRVAAFASSKGTYGPGDQPPDGYEIPMFFAVGSQDKEEWVTGSLVSIAKGARKAPWTLAFSPKEGHGPGASLDVAIPFLASAVAQRLGDKPAVAAAPSIFKSQLPSASSSSSSTGSASARLVRIDARAGWLGDPESLDIAPYADFKRSKTKAVWLPDEATAQAWQAYLRK